MSYEFDSGSTEYFASATTPITTYPFWVSAWIKYPSSGAATGTFFSIADSAGNVDYFAVIVTSVGQARINARDSGTNDTATVSTANITADTWAHVLGIFASATSRTIYQELVDTATSAVSVSPAGIDRMAIGVTHRSSALTPFEGHIAEVVLATGVPSWSDISMLSGRFGLTGVPRLARSAELVGYWPLEGDDYSDHSGNAYHMTPVNSPTPRDTHPVLQKVSEPRIGEDFKYYYSIPAAYLDRKRRTA